MAGCMQHCNEELNCQKLKLKTYFVELISEFLKGNSGDNCFRPLPPTLGNGHCIDLLKLYFVVKFKGGFEVISEKNLWGEVSLQCGLGSGFGPAFKLIYDKYLGCFESWLMKLDKEKSLESNLMELEGDYQGYVSKIMDVNRGSDSCSFKLEKSGISFIDLTDEDDEDEKVVIEFDDSEGSNEGNDESLKSKQCNVKVCLVDDVKSSVKSKELKDGMSFAGAEDSAEGNGETVDSKQKCIVIDTANDDRGGKGMKQVRSEMSFVDGVSSDVSHNKRFLASSFVAKEVVKSSVNSVTSMKCSSKGDVNRMFVVGLGVSKEVSSQKRKRNGYSGMLQWMADVAKDPTNPVIGEIPGSSKWASYGNDITWKQALLARQALFFKKIQSRNTEQFSSQKKPKMHPSLFDYYEKLSTSTSNQTDARPRQRLEARLDMQPAASIYTCRPQQRIPVGKTFQAEVPEWAGVTVESDPKWLGTQTWPLEKSENRRLTEKDPLGKGRPDSCGCQFPGSTECVKSHVAERRMKTRFELGSAFYAWSFDKMGEDCNVSWTIEEEKKFRRVVKENPQSLQRCFWEPMCEALPQKRWADQVNYYYNVFMLRRRGYQNRHYPTDIDSGDDETEYQSTCNSIRRGSAA